LKVLSFMLSINYIRKHICCYQRASLLSIEGLFKKLVSIGFNNISFGATETTTVMLRWPNWWSSAFNGYWLQGCSNSFFRSEGRRLDGSSGHVAINTTV
jgi:hypothetical protein